MRLVDPTKSHRGSKRLRRTLKTDMKNLTGNFTVGI